MNGKSDIMMLLDDLLKEFNALHQANAPQAVYEATKKVLALKSRIIDMVEQKWVNPEDALPIGEPDFDSDHIRCFVITEHNEEE